MKNKNQIQQGDVLLRRVNETPNGKVVAKGKCTLAYGEATGHHHTIELEEDEAQLIQEGERMLLVLERAGVLTHQEHGPITVEPGIWEVGRVREKDWLSGMVAPVVD